MAALQRRLLLLAAAVGALVAAPTVAVAEEAPSPWKLRGMLQVVNLDDGTVIQAEEFRGPPKLSALPLLFSGAAVDVHCPGRSHFSVYTGPSMGAVRSAFERGESAWCGLSHWLQESSNCTVTIPPYGSTFVAVAKPKSWRIGGGSHECHFQRREWLSVGRLLAFAVGAWLFWSAGVLSESTPFRLTGGTLGFMALSSVILLLFLYRRVPHKGKLMAGAAVFGSSFVATVRWVFGVWLPSLNQIMHSPITLGYLAISGLSGLATTYYYNNTENRKVNNMLRVALQLVGLTSVYASTSMHEGSVALVAGLLGYKAWTFLQQHRSMREALASAKRNVQRQLAGEEGPEVGAAGERGDVGMPAAAAAGSSRQQQQQQGTPVVVERVVVPEVSPLIQRGLILNEETGHIIGIGKATYNRLKDAGYVVDQLAGTITPPPPSPGSPARAGRSSGRGRRRSKP